MYSDHMYSVYAASFLGPHATFHHVEEAGKEASLCEHIT